MSCRGGREQRLSRVAIKESLSRSLYRLAQRRRQTMQRTVAQNTAKRTLTAPVPAGLDGNLARDVVFVVVDVQPQGAANVVLDQLAQAAFTMEDALGGAEDVVAVGEQAGEVGGGVGGNVEDVPDVGHDRQRCPL